MTLGIDNNIRSSLPHSVMYHTKEFDIWTITKFCKKRFKK